jgi:hypothetical protein
MRTDGETGDMTKLIDAFRNFTNALKNKEILGVSRFFEPREVLGKKPNASW